MELMESFLDKGYKLHVDNYSISLPLFEGLQGRSALACATVQSNRTRVRRNITDIHNEEIRALKRGESVCRQKNIMTCVGWKDSKMVHTMATTPVDPTSNSEVNKCGKQMTKTTVSEPSVIIF